MADTIYNRFLTMLMSSTIDLDSDTINCILLTSTYSIDKDHTSTSDVMSYETSGSGYTAGGAALVSKSINEDMGSDLAYFDSDDPFWSSSTITARFAVLWNVTRDILMGVWDFSTDKSSASGTFTVQVNASGWFKIEQP